MSKISPLPSSKLYTSFDANKIPWKTSNDIPKSLRKDFSQPRAVKALTLALNIKDNGYNVYLAGENDLGRSYMLSQFLKPIALKKETPPDLLYVNNFENEDNPILLKVLAGQGKVLKREIAKILQQIKKEIPLRFETHAYEKKRQALLSNFQKIRESFIKEMDIIAEKQGFNLDIDEQGSLTLYPLVEGKRLSDEDFEMLDVNIRSAIKRKSDHLLHSMTAVIKKLSKAERDYKQSQKDLDKEVMIDVLHKYFTPFQEKFCSHAGIYEESVTVFFENMYKDMLENMDLFLAKETPIPLSLAELTIPALPSQENSLSRYELNLFVDNSKLKGAPVIFESHPTFFNVLGCIERESEMGALSTNFTLIKAGCVHRANGGYLAFHIEDLLAHPTAWDGLMRVLRAQKSKVEDDSNELIKTKTLSPQALDLDLKVILIGTDNIYETLLENDDRFSKLFKIKAQMSIDTERNTPNIKAWLHNLAHIIDDFELDLFASLKNTFYSQKTSQKVDTKEIRSLKSLHSALALLHNNLSPLLPQETLKNSLTHIMEKLENQHFSIGITGVLSAGKSTFLNALLSQEILGSSSVPETANLTILRYGESAGARVHFWSKEQWAD